MLVRRPDAFDARADFHFSLQHGADATLPRDTGYLLWGVELVLLGCLYLAVALLPLGRWRRPPGVAIKLAGILALLGGAALIAQTMA
jgi:hypothetical protein